jgi:hypothetical protein
MRPKSKSFLLLFSILALVFPQITNCKSSTEPASSSGKNKKPGESHENEPVTDKAAKVKIGKKESDGLNCDELLEFNGSKLSDSINIECGGISADAGSSSAEMATYYSVSLTSSLQAASGQDQLLITLSSDDPDFLPVEGKEYDKEGEKYMSVNFNRATEPSETIDVDKAKITFVNPSRKTGDTVTVNISVTGKGRESSKIFSATGKAKLKVIKRK